MTDATIINEKSERVAVGKLTSHPANPRVGNVDAIVKSIQSSGFYGVVVAQRSTGYVLAGNHRLQAAAQLGMAKVPVVWLDVDDERALRILLADNRTNDLAGYDEHALADLLRGLEDTDAGLDGSGYDGDALDDLLTKLAAENSDPASVPDPPAPELPRSAVTKRGDIIVMGSHRLGCGDATDPEFVQRVFDGRRADIVFTDPPYGISYQDVKGKHRPIENDDADPRDLVSKALAALPMSSEGRPRYVCCDWRSIGAMVDAMGGAKSCIVWDKQRGVQNLDRYFKQHEMIAYDGPFGGERTVRGDVWGISREPNPGDHPTPKPTELIATALLDSSECGDVVADPFLGSGSTLIAADALDRTCIGVEIDPRYCDVVVMRWEEATGQTAVRP